jgi:hypothetical protein
VVVSGPGSVLELFVCRAGQARPFRWQILFGHPARGGLPVSGEFGRKRDALLHLRRLKCELVASADLLQAARWLFRRAADAGG